MIKNNRINLFFFGLIIASLFFVLGFLGYSKIDSSQFQKVNQSYLRDSPDNFDLSFFWETYNLIRKNFVEAEKIENKKLLEGAISGMVESLQDPYTVFFTPEETKKFLDEVSGSFEGIGIEVGKRKGQIQVIAPLEGTPAQKAGLRAGDKILKINDKTTEDLSLDEAVNLIRGPKETQVTLLIIREGWQEPKEFKLNRDIINIPSLKWEIKEGDIAYLQLYNFSEKSAKDFNKAAWEILNSPAKRIILDLRNNPGGYLEVAQEIAGWFLKRDQVVAIEDFGSRKKQQIYTARGNGKLASYPLVVLINKGSASASEILAGALRDNRQVKLIGEKSFGKGSIQELEKMSKGYSLKITIAYWLTPKGDLIAEKGLEPDIKVEMTEKDYEEGLDPQLNKALEIVKSL
jgi:carboxyl-terminal processing protease